MRKASRSSLSVPGFGGYQPAPSPYSVAARSPVAATPFAATPYQRSPSFSLASPTAGAYSPHPGPSPSPRSLPRSPAAPGGASPSFAGSPKFYYNQSVGHDMHGAVLFDFIDPCAAKVTMKRQRAMVMKRRSLEKDLSNQLGVMSDQSQIWGEVKKKRGRPKLEAMKTYPPVLKFEPMMSPSPRSAASAPKRRGRPRKFSNVSHSRLVKQELFSPTRRISITMKRGRKKQEVKEELKSPKVMKTQKVLKQTQAPGEEPQHYYLSTDIATGTKARNRVFRGAKDRTVWGLTQDHLMRNQRKKVVSKRARLAATKRFENNNLRKFVDSVKAAKLVLGFGPGAGFIPVGGKTEQGQLLLARAREIYRERRIEDGTLDPSAPKTGKIDASYNRTPLKPAIDKRTPRPQEQLPIPEPLLLPHNPKQTVDFEHVQKPRKKHEMKKVRENRSMRKNSRVSLAPRSAAGTPTSSESHVPKVKIERRGRKKNISEGSSVTPKAKARGRKKKIPDGNLLTSPSPRSFTLSTRAMVKIERIENRLQVPELSPAPRSAAASSLGTMSPRSLRRRESLFSLTSQRRNMIKSSPSPRSAIPGSIRGSPSPRSFARRPSEMSMPAFSPSPRSARRHSTFSIPAISPSPRSLEKDSPSALRSRRGSKFSTGSKNVIKQEKNGRTPHRA